METLTPPINFVDVIVDVPTMQTNQPYTYRVPTVFSKRIQVGMRVVVPFGKGDRLVQGFVVGIKQEAKTTYALKAVHDLMDLTPVLNKEALHLAQWMAGYTFSFTISCLQTMLPRVLRAKYGKQIVITGDKCTLPAEIRALFQTQTALDYYDERITPSMRAQLATLQRQGELAITYLVQDQAKVKTAIWIEPAVGKDKLTEIAQRLRKNAVNQRRLITAMLESMAGFWQKDVPIPAATFIQAEKHGWLIRVAKEVYRDPYRETNISASQPPQLTPDQLRAVQMITPTITDNQNQVFLLQGVTGSGKTEVYLQCIAQALMQGKTALMLVPEIALTPQMVQRVRARFGKQVAVLHSGLSDGEKYDEWRRIERREAQVVVGVRSAIFAPLDNIGIIIIDEEHEASYKQEEMPRYHTRDVAKWRAAWHHCPLVLGSATPSLETRARAQKGVYQGIAMPRRINGKGLPRVQLVDMRQEYKQSQEADFSRPMVQAIEQRLLKHEQVVLMLNRRGYSSFLMCRECGFVLKCPNCDISLTLHMDTNNMKCHYCGHIEDIPHFCPNCRSTKIRYYGTGTEKVQEELMRLFPQARVLRMDVDTTRKKGAHERLLQKFGDQQADILLGTQMIAKGLDFPNVTLVGVLNADTALSLPNFRSSERTFQLLTQVSGRAGRADKEGLVIIQTYNPEHYAIQDASHQNYEQFYRTEMQIRRQMGYSPYYYSIKITVSAATEGAAAKRIYQLNDEVKQILSPQARLVGPSPQSILRIKKRYYFQLIIKYKKEPALDAFLQTLLQQSQNDERKGVRIIIDRDPINNI